MLSAPFRAAVESKDLEKMRAALSENVVFHSPVVFKAYEGIEATMYLLSNVAEIFEDFVYTDQVENDRVAMLVFKAKVGDREVEGLDLLRFGDDGLINDFTVFVRPMSGMHALAEAMRERLGA